MTMARTRRRQHKRPVVDMQFLTSGISTTLVLVLLGLVLFFVLTARNLSVYVRENISFSVLLSDDMRQADVDRLRKQLEHADFVRSVEYVSKEQALREQTEALGTDPSEFSGENPYSASLEIRLRSQYANMDSIARIEQQFNATKGIEEVLYRKDLIDAVNENIRKITLFLLGLAVVLALVSFALINNTVKLAIYSHRFLIHTMTLVGANWSFIRRPFLRRHVWIGVLSGLVAAALLWAAAYWLVKAEPGLISVITSRMMVVVSVSVVVAGVLITWLCALLSVNRFLRMRASELHYV